MTWEELKEKAKDVVDIEAARKIKELERELKKNA